ncbi:MAG: hypothetical protein J1F22_07530 [Lachnospiraceae bacterium]|nr:hypothetical protein [Lachnospiraceae bacterium]
MADYMREIIYLKKIEDGMVGAGGGFARLNRKKGRMTIHLSLEGKVTDSEEKVYLIYKRHGILLPFPAGTTGASETSELEISDDRTQGLPVAEEICGIIIGNSSSYWTGACRKHNGDISYEQVHFTKEREKTNPKPEVEPEPELKTETEPQTEQKSEVEQNPEPESVKAATLEGMPAQEPEKLQDPFLAGLAEMYPFEDDEMAWCRQIEPSDFSSFPMEFWHYSRNSFLLQGFYNYRHLLYAHSKDKNYIGVPGQFHRREQYLASRFGFPRFKGTHKKRVTVGDFGYWLKEL